MSLQSDLRTYLLSSSDVTALIGQKLYPHRAQQAGSTGQSGAITPYVTYQVITDQQGTILTEAAGFADMRLQLTAWSTSYNTAWAITEAIRQELHGLGNTTAVTTSYVFSIRHAGSEDMPEPPEDFSDAGHYGVATDYMILYRTAVPTF